MTETVVNVQEAPNNNAANKQQAPQGESPLSWIKINLDYFRTLPGLLKIAEVVSFFYISSNTFILNENPRKRTKKAK